MTKLLCKLLLHLQDFFTKIKNYCTQKMVCGKSNRNIRFNQLYLQFFTAIFNPQVTLILSKCMHSNIFKMWIELQESCPLLNLIYFVYKYSDQHDTWQNSRSCSDINKFDLSLIFQGCLKGGVLRQIVTPDHS